MSFAEVLQELPTLTLSERQLLVRRALDLDDPALSPADEALVEKRLAAHRQNPASAVPLETMKSRLRSRFKK
jgi:putative addiction module component (TIGR02574 family)